MQYKKITLEDITEIIRQQMLPVNLKEDNIYEYDRQESPF